MYERTTLDNGVKVITHRMPGMLSAAVGVWIKVGGRYETEGNKGISHYLEHLLFKGSRKYSCRKIKESIEGVGGSLNGFTSEEVTCYLAKLPYRYLDRGLEILSDMVLHPMLAARDVEKERTVILEELKMYRDLPQSHVHDLMDALLWPRQMLGASVIGSVESVSRISRQDLAKFQSRHYSGANIVVSAAGNLSHRAFVAQVRGYFKGLAGASGNEFLPAKIAQDGPQVSLLPKDTEQTHLLLGFHSFERDHPLRYAQALLHIILGANMSSRLFNEVREKRGLAYEIGTQVKRFQDTGAFLVHAGIDNAKVVDAIKVVMKELGRIRRAAVSEDEFARAKEFYQGQLSLALEDTMEHMLWIGESEALLHKTVMLREVIRHIRALTRGEVLQVAREVFKEDHLNLAAIGPLAGREKDLRAVLSLA